MNKLVIIFSFLWLAACNPPSDKRSNSKDEARTKAISEIKVPVYAWMGGPKGASDKELQETFLDLKNQPYQNLQLKLDQRFLPMNIY